MVNERGPQEIASFISSVKLFLNNEESKSITQLFLNAIDEDKIKVSVGSGVNPTFSNQQDGIINIFLSEHIHFGEGLNQSILDMVFDVIGELESKSGPGLGKWTELKKKVILDVFGNSS